MVPWHGAAAPAAVQPAGADVATRFAVHDGFDRLVLSLPPNTQAVSRQSNNVVLVQLPGCGHVMQPLRWGRRLLALRDAPGQVTLKLAPGSRARVWRVGDRLVVDALNAPAVQPPPIPNKSDAVPASTPAPAGAAAKAPSLQSTVSGASTGLAQPVKREASALPQAVQKPSRQATAEAGRAASEAARKISAHPPPSPPGKPADVPALDTAAPVAGSAVLPLTRGGDIDGPAVLVPCPRGTGAAAFERAGEAHIVFDQARPLDLSALRDDPIFGMIREQILTDGLELRLHLTAGGQLRLLRHADGWALILTLSAHVPALAAFEGRMHGGTLALDANGPGHVIILADEVTGGRLLVGTQTGDGQRMAATHAAPEFTILPSWQGLVVAPTSDRLMMRVSPSGFELLAQTRPELALAWSKAGAVSWPDGRVMTRLFDLPDLPPESLHRRLGQALRDAALAPKLSRFAPRVTVARDMLAQNMDVEAGAVLRTAVSDEPARLGDPEAAGLSAMAGWLSARAGGADAPPGVGFDPARLGNSDEAVLWRALLQPGTPDSATQAAALAPVWPLIFTYPQALRRPMLLASSSLLQAGGQSAAWAALLAASSDPALDLSRANLLQQQGRTAEALALLDRVAGRPDRLARADAMQQALELRVATHALSASDAADALDRQLYAWRGGDRELKLRMRVAAWRAQAGAWRSALSTLRSAEQAFPEARTMLHAAEEKTVADLLDGEHAGRLSSFDLVSLAEEAANLFSSAEVERRLGPILVDRLLALDLPERAEPILRKLFDRAPDPASRAAYGLGLASLIADRGLPQAALEILGRPDGDGLPSDLIDRRTLMRARLLGASGNADEALALLAGRHDPAASDIQAGLLETRHDWTGASAVLQAALQHQQFSQVPEQTQRAMILRLARDESTGSDAAGLRALRQAERARFATGDGAELFAILTADPVTSAADLPRSGREIAGLRALPAKLAQPRTF